MFIRNNHYQLSKVFVFIKLIIISLKNFFYFDLGLFSLAKQKIRNVQDNLTTIPNEQSNIYAQYFSSDFDDSFSQQTQQIGYIHSYNDRFNKLRKAKHNQISIETTRLLLRLQQLTSNDDNIPKTTNTKERRSKISKRTIFQRGI